MDNERHAIENIKPKARLATIGHIGRGSAGVFMLSELLAAYGLVSPLAYDRAPTLKVKSPPRPPSEKPRELRDENDHRRIQKAEEKRRRRAEKRRKQLNH